MKTRLNWEDLDLFAAVARGGSLKIAAEALGTSVPTLSRRMRALEARLERRLFLHGQAGYQLTPDGRDLLRQTAPMEAAAKAIETWHSAQPGAARVRISAGSWTARHLARNIHRYWTKDAPWVPEFVASNTALDLPRREIDIGIRNRRPDQPWLAAQRTGHVDYAPYAAPGAPDGWIAVSGNTPTARWVQQHHADAILTTVNQPSLALDLARAGTGRVLLPCFVGGPEPALQRCASPIDALRSEEWLVTHNEARHEPAIRAALTALAGFLRTDKGGAPAS